MHHHWTGLGLGLKDTGWPTPHGRRAAGPRAWPSGWPVCTSYETHLRSSPPPTATRHCTRVSAGVTLLPRKLEGSPLARAGWTGHGIHADHGLLAPGLLFYEECPGLQSTQLCSREHQGGLSLGPGSLPNLSSDRNLERRGEACTLSALDPGLLVVRPPAWHGILVGTSCGFHAMLTRHMTQNKFCGPANSE